MNQYDDDDRRPNPVRPDPPLFAPVVFGDDDDDEPPRRRGLRPPGGGGEDYESDASLIRVLGIIVVLGLVIIALVLPWSPVRMIGGGDGDDTIRTTARDDLPALPEGMTSLSKLYEITVPESVNGPLSVEVRLISTETDGSNLAYYSWANGTWARLGSVTLAQDGNSVVGAIPGESVSIAVLRRDVLAGSLALIVEAGATPDPRAVGSASTVAVVAAQPSANGPGELTVAEDALAPAIAAAGDAVVLFGVTDGGNPVVVQTAIASDTTSQAHAEAIVAAAQAQRAGGVYVDYASLPADARARLTAFVETLAIRTAAEGLQLVVSVPPPAGADTGAYDWDALLSHADALWLRAPANPTEFFSQLEAGLAARGDTPLDRVLLVLDRRSVEETGSGLASITTRDALAFASTIDRRVEAIAPGGPVTLRTANLGTGTGSGSLTWDDTARSVAFQGGGRTVWVTNRYSVAFRLDLAGRFGLGGVAIEGASDNDALPDIWEPVAQYLEAGLVSLMRPYGPYLAPCWQAEGGTLEGQPACFEGASAPGTVVWRAPASPGAYTVRLVVSDGVIFVAQEIALRVGDEATPSPTPTPTATTEPAPTATEEPAPTATEEPEPEPTEEPTEVPEEEPEDGDPPGPAGNDDEDE